VFKAVVLTVQVTKIVKLTFLQLLFYSTQMNEIYHAGDAKKALKVIKLSSPEDHPIKDFSLKKTKTKIVKNSMELLPFT